MKFGGTSIGDGKRIRHVVTIIKDHVAQEDKVVLVVSALNGVTDYLINISKKAVAGRGID